MAVNLYGRLSLIGILKRWYISFGNILNSNIICGKRIYYLTYYMHICLQDFWLAKYVPLSLEIPANITTDNSVFCHWILFTADGRWQCKRFSCNLLIFLIFWQDTILHRHNICAYFLFYLKLTSVFNLCLFLLVIFDSHYSPQKGFLLFSPNKNL